MTKIILMVLGTIVTLIGVVLLLRALFPPQEKETVSFPEGTVIVQKGDTYASIAADLGVDENALRTWNMDREIEAGSVLEVPQESGPTPGALPTETLDQTVCTNGKKITLAQPLTLAEVAAMYELQPLDLIEDNVFSVDEVDGMMQPGRTLCIRKGN